MATSSTSSLSASRVHDYFETGPNHILCKISGLEQESFPETFHDSWDINHVRLACSGRIYPTDVSLWPEIVKGLNETIVTSQQLSEVMLRWNKGKQNGWNINALDAFLNNRSIEEYDRAQGAHSDVVLDDDELRAAQAALESDEYLSNNSEAEGFDHQDEVPQQQPLHQHSQGDAGGIEPSGGPLKSQFLSREEREHFFDVILPRMQALALRLPELITKPIPFLKQQQDAAVTLSQEQIACLLANAFFNTFPCRNVPYKRGRKKRPAFKRGNSSGTNVGQSQQQQQAGEDEDDDESDEEEEAHPRAKQSSRGGGRGGARGCRGGRGGGGQVNPPYSKKKSLNAPRPPRKHRYTGPAAQFEFIEDSNVTELSARVENLKMKDKDVTRETAEAASSSSTQPKTGEQEWLSKMPSINFISMFWSEENRTPCTTAQAAKLRCILHYFDRVTSEMPAGTVTYHRQVLKKPTYLAAGERLTDDDFCFSKVTVDSMTPIEEAPQGALQLDFANRNIGGGTLEKGAVQEEIRFMVCPELIISRLFCQQMEANEAVLIKGAERYSNYVGYSKTFEWYSNHRDSTPRDKLGRRWTEICAIDARPFRSRISRLEQFDRHYCLREINKAIVGFRISPINASEWGMARQDDDGDVSASTARYRPIATGNWGCGAFGGHLQLKFVLQWIAASMCGGFSPETGRLGDDVLYYTFGMHQLKCEIEEFVKAVEAMDKNLDPKRVVECLTQYPRRNPAGDIQGFREKSLLEYLSTAIAFVPQA
ncbi:hypothetical protein BGZ58_002106 [Dissophora ornata]|nr:hypothetical protein BGZ58_002106 [Dissophora ornata]